MSTATTDVQPLTPRPRSGPAVFLAVAAKIAVSATLIFVLLRRTEFSEILLAFRSADPRLLGFAFALNFLGYFLSITRWRVLLAAQGVPAPFLTLTRSHMTAFFFNNLLPSTIGGDAIRAYDSWRLGASRTVAVAVIFMDRFTGVIALALFALAALLLSGWLPWNHPAALPAALAIATIAGIASAILAYARRSAGHPMRLRLNYRAHATIERITSAFRAFATSPGTLARAFGLSVLLQINVIVFYVLIASAFDLGVPVLAFFMVIPIALAVMLLPISVNAIGIRENIFVYLLGIYGVAAPDAVAFAWAAFGILLIHGVMGGVVYALGR